MWPGEDIRVRCNANVNGTNVYAPDQLVTVGADKTVKVNFVLPTPPAPTTGAIEGILQTPGPLTPKNWIWASRWLLLENDGEDGPYFIDELPVGTYRVRAWTAFNNNRQRLTTHPRGGYSPPTTDRRYDVTAGATTQVDISTTQEFLTGRVNITGTASHSDLITLRVHARGVTNTQSGVTDDTRADHTNGDYELVVSEGPWSINKIYMRFRNSSSDPAEHIDETLNFWDRIVAQNPITISPGIPGIQNFDLSTGEVTVNLSIAGNTGITLSNPRLNGSCSLRDENNHLVSSYSFNASNNNLQDLETGSVRFFGMEGTCNLEARATIDGANVDFGTLTVNMIPGVTQVIDIGGPTLTVQFPEPDFITSNSSITVTGIVTDDVEVAGVTVNGVTATLVSTGNTSDEAEMSFSATIPLQRGPNEITTVATDTADPAKTSSDTRTVFRDEGPPTLSWTPADGAVLPLTGAMTSIDGIADDDAGIKSITVNGQVVAFLSTGNTNEVSFNTSFTLPAGDHFITVVATDISNRITSQTHKIIVTENRPPVAICSNVTASAGTGCTADADVNSGSYDPDDDPITTSQSPAGPYGLGITTVTLTVTDDSEISDTCSTTVTVVDDTDPVITCPADVTLECPADTSVAANGSATATDNCSVDSITYSDSSATGCGNTEVITRTWTATDGSGNTATCAQTITVVDTTPPTITCPADVALECLAADTSVAANGSATGSDTCGSVTISHRDVSVPGCGNTVTITRTWTATDNCSNSTSCDQTITVVDTTAPVLVGIPADVTVECDSVPAPASPTATDTCSTATIAFSETRTDGASPNDYVLTRTWMATDECSNSSSQSQTVTVQDNTPPTVTASASPDYLWPANHKMHQISWSGTATDNCDGSPGGLTICSVTSDESDNSWNPKDGDGNTNNDIQIVDGILYLRAERAGKGDGRVYTITVCSTDASGNTGSTTFTVEVPHDSDSHSCDDPDCDLNNSTTQ